MPMGWFSRYACCVGPSQFDDIRELWYSEITMTAWAAVAFVEVLATCAYWC